MIFHPDDRSDDEIVTVTAKIWYVSDYLGKYRETLGYQKVDENCVGPSTMDDAICLNFRSKLCQKG